MANRHATPADVPAVVVADSDGRVISQNAVAVRLMGDGEGRPCWEVVGGLQAPGLYCRHRCVQELIAHGMNRSRHDRIELEGQRHQITCVPLEGAVVCTLSAAAEQQPEDWQPLTPREREVLQLLSQGHTTRSIALRLGLAPATVRTHVEHMRRKFGVSTRGALVARAYEFGLLG